MPEKQQECWSTRQPVRPIRGEPGKAMKTSYGLNLRNSEGACNFVVCDGMGGAAAGEVASRMAVEAMLACHEPRAC